MGEPGGEARVAFHVGGGREEGTGHLQRCRALARHLGPTRTDLLVDAEKADLLAICRALGIPCVTVEGDGSPGGRAASVAARLRELGTDLLVVDLFEVEEAYLRRLREAVPGLPVVALDDYSIRRPVPDVVIKPHLVEAWYGSDDGWDGTTLLTGPEYWILRGGLRELSARRRTIREEPRTVLVTMGGSDPGELTAWLTRELGALPTIPRLRVVCGPGYAGLERVRAAAAAAVGAGWVEVLASPEDFDRLMFTCDLAVTAGGYTVYELAALGTPMAILPWAEHQREHAAAMAARGAAVDLGPPEELDGDGLREAVGGLLGSPDRRREMSAAGRATVDGRGMDRVTERLRRLG